MLQRFITSKAIMKLLQNNKQSDHTTRARVNKLRQQQNRSNYIAQYKHPHNTTDHHNKTKHNGHPDRCLFLNHPSCPK